MKALSKEEKLPLPSLPMSPLMYSGTVGEPTPTSVQAAEEHGCPTGCPCHAARAPEGASGHPSPQDAPRRAGDRTV